MISQVPSIDDYPTLKDDIQRTVAFALEEDIRDGDITAELIPADADAKATIITREDCVVCGIAWAEEVFQQLGSKVVIKWFVKDGDKVDANTTLCELSGNARDLLTGERTALNFLQLLSGTATSSWHFAQLVKDSSLKILDTRKTIPGLRTAQKYAVKCGGCFNHRIGLYDAFLIKENHIAACGSISNAVTTARKNHPDKTVEVEVESIEELKEAIAVKTDIIMLDNFSEEQLKEAVALKNQEIAYERSGNLDEESIKTFVEGIDFSSSGALTKHVKAVDLSMRVMF